MMNAAGSGSGTTNPSCSPLPCPSGAPWNQAKCACDSGAANQDACMVDSDCVLVGRGCCSCPPNTADNVIAAPRARGSEVQKAQCAGQVACGPCAAPVIDPLAPVIHAGCIDHKCAAVDLRTVEFSKCAQDGDCVALGLGCCGSSSGDPASFVGANKSADDGILQCVPAPPCQPPPQTPEPPPISFCATDGHCAVRARETQTQAASTTCYSPSQNVDRAYDTDAKGCDCQAGTAGVCVKDSMSRFVGFLCSPEGYWQSVFDGPCGKKP